ncbi:hypothetical protein AURDEDRAFT_166643 [Auricularia subglabra TFB-10046 SS5]|nr:hypothetical protein AURDEDRAFT_166643 [Auricularia subglabra TFB-10046 SS5]
MRVRKVELPDELILAILEWLSPDELWTSARVSRLFYAQVWHAGLIIERYIMWMPGPGYASQLDVFKEVLEHVKKKNLRLGLCISSYFPGEHLAIYRSGIYEASRDTANAIMPVITAALPFLVRLTVRLPDHFRPQLDAALRFPAPRLRMLELDRTLRDGVSPPIPSDLFAGSAPQLRTVACAAGMLSEDPVAAFRGVTRVVLSYMYKLPPIAIRLSFPLVKWLHLAFLAADGDGAPPDQFDLSGLALDSLVIRDCGGAIVLDAVERSTDLSVIPHVHVITNTLRWTELLWIKDAAMLSLRLYVCPEDGDDICVMVTPEHRRWHRLYRLAPWITDEPVPIAGLPGLASRLTYLRVDAALLRALLTLAVSFLALRDIHIDVRSAEAADHLVLGPPDYGMYSRVQSFDPQTPHNAVRIWSPCPVLEEITLFAWDAVIEDADSRRVAFLFRALGQLERPKTERAALALVGVQFEKPVARDLLRQTVSQIRRYAFAGRGSHEDSDDGLWDHGF